MHRYPTLHLAVCSLVVVSGLAGCSGHRPAPATPAPQAAAPAAPASKTTAPAPTRSASSDLTAIPPAPVIDSIDIDIDIAAELRAERLIAADSAADEAVLSRLAEAKAPGAGESDETAPEAGGEKALTGSTTTWDIDVESFNNHDRVQYYLDFFQKTAHDRFGIWLSRMARYESMIRDRLQRQGLPGDLVYLALIESGFSNSAVSRARAVGMWQFMKGTARHYGLRVDSWVDERRDPTKATHAAVRFLSDLYRRFGSIYLAAAAYNAGGGKIGRSLDRLEDDEEESDSLVYSDATFFKLYDTKLLRRETRDYVPKLIAAAVIAKEPERYGFASKAAAPEPFDSIVVPDMTGLDVLARLADTTLAAVRELNPQYLRLATPPGTASVVRLPAGRGPATVAAYATLPARQRVTFYHHTVARGETISGIAHRYGVSQRALVDANAALRRGKLRAGQHLVVPTGGITSSAVARQMAEDMPTLFHRVRRGETLSGLADRYDATVSQLRRWNALGKHGRIRAGMRIRVAAPRAPVRTVVSKAPHAIAANPPAEGHAKGAGTDTGRVGARTHVVRRGETLTALAKRYGVSVAALKQANGLTGAAKIRAGATIKIPA